jgi:hypothetical protein
MLPVNFPQANGALLPAPGTEDRVDPLPVWRGKDQHGQDLVVSCFSFTAEEFVKLGRDGKIYLLVHGQTQPPVAIMAESPFT